MMTHEQLSRKARWYMAQTLLLAMTVFASAASAQSDPIRLRSKNLTRQEAINEIQNQTSFKLVFNARNLEKETTVNFGATNLPLNSVLDKLTEGTKQQYTVDGDYIILFETSIPDPASVVTVGTNRKITGTVTNNTDAPLEGVTVELIDIDGKKSATFANGRFMIEGIPPGNYIAKLSSADGATVRYREVSVNAGSDTDITMVLNDEILVATPPRTPQSVSTPPPSRPTAYFVPSAPVDNTVRAFTDEPKTEMSFIPATQINGNMYLPKAAVKTNLLVLGTATPNIAVEFGLSPKWTIDLSTGYNPFQLQDGGINKAGFIQPEVRYWFCQRFEKHFVGLHGTYIGYNIGEVSFLTKTFENNRYKGWGAGAGISYGYHLPLGKRWALEFTAGVGYMYLEYDQYRCYECDELTGRNSRNYFGPTRAGVSLVFMIK